MSRLLCLLFASGFALLCLPVRADQIVLDDVMTPQEQKETGVANLGFQQKVALEMWLNKNFVLKQKGQKTESSLSLSINIDGGQKLQLSDNSIWEIAPNDVPISSLWITPFPVKIAPSNDLDFPFLIVNTNSGVSVKARRVSATGQPIPTQPHATRPAP